MIPLILARRLLPLAGITAFALAALSLGDMFLPRPYDGVVLESDAPGQLMVADVVGFFLIFPRPLWECAAAPLPVLARPRLRRRLLTASYLLPLGVYAYNLLFCMWRGEWILISGAPRANWWLLGAPMVLGLAALGANTARLTRTNERRGAGFIFLGTAVNRAMADLYRQGKIVTPRPAAVASTEGATASH